MKLPMHILHSQFCSASLILLALGGRAQTIGEISRVVYAYPDSAIVLSHRVIARWDGDWSELGDANHLLGLAHWVKGSHPEALQYYREAQAIREEKGDSSGLANTINNMGLVYWNLNLREEALESYHQSLGICEKIKDTTMMAKVLGNIGILLEEQGDRLRALEFHTRSLGLAEAKNDNATKANALNNIGHLNIGLNRPDVAVGFLNQSLELYRMMENRTGEALSLENLGMAYSGKGYHSLAERYLNESLVIFTETDNDCGQAASLAGLAENALILGSAKEALEFGQRALAKARECANPDQLVRVYRALISANAKLGRHAQSGEYLELFIAMKDSISREESQGRITIMQQQFEFQRDREKLEDEREAERALAESELSRQVLIRNGIFGLGLLALVFLGLQYRNFKRERKSKELLTLKNEEISRQKQEITDSIIYAKRLQDARLPGSATLNRLFGDCRVFYRPKDIVSGDFYWAEEAGGISFLAVADCTGHGVPGAMVSMVATEGLNEAVLKQHLSDPAKILHYLNNHIQTAFHTQSSEVRDGLDIALISFNPKEKRIRFAGANSSVFVVSEKETMDGAVLKTSVEGKYLHEIKGDRTGIGGRDASVHFMLKTWTSEPGQILLFSSDGYADQFGGSKGKKLGSKRSREIWLEALSSGDFGHIEREFDQWKGREEQVDDVTVAALLS